MLFKANQDPVKAGRQAYDACDGRHVAVIERFDLETFERDGDTYGELWIADQAGEDQLTEAGVEWQDIDSYGSDAPDVVAEITQAFEAAVQVDHLTNEQVDQVASILDKLD